MQVSVETTQGLQRRMTVQVPSERVDKEVDGRLRSLGNTVRLDGFRPGKVPFKVLQKRFGAQVRGEVLGEVLESSFGEALAQEKLRPAGAPEIDTTQTEAGKDLEYTATFEIMPEVEVKGVSEIKVERPQVEIADVDIDRVVENLRKQQAEFVETDRAAEEDDQVIVDFKGLIDGEPFAGNEGEDVPVRIGSGQMPVEFEEALKGVKAGENKTFDYTFPEQFPDADIATKTAQFEVTVKRVEAPQLPEVDADFAEKLGFSDGVDGMRQKIREILEGQRDQAVRGLLKPQVLNQLADANEFELPQVLVDTEIEELRGQTPGNDADDEKASGEIETEARRRVALGLLVNEIVRGNEIKIDQDRVRKTLEDMVSQYEQPQELIRYYLQNRELMQGIELSVLEDQVVDWLLEQAQVTDKPQSFEELMSPEASEPADDKS